MFSALLDTCVLVPSRARDVLLEAASAGAYRHGARGDRCLPGPAVRADGDIFSRCARDGLGITSRRRPAPGPGDRHVVAAARAGRADVIVTDNVADFPPGALPAPLVRQSLDEFLLGSFDLYPGQVISAVHAVAGRTGRSGPAMTARDIAAYLQARGMPAFGERLLANLDQPGRA